jgi:putative ABC transport system substrate-binding protein
MNLARPGYNVTGLINLYDELAKKHIEMIKELLPKMRRVGVLAVDTIPASRVAETIRGAAQQLKIETVVSKVGSPEKSAQGLQRLKEATVSAVIVLTSPTLMAARQSIVDSAAQLRMPMITTDREYTELGGLISYGANRAELAYLAASYVDKILKGASAGDLPIQQPTKFEMVVNLKTAKALGIKIPNSILVRADKVIE